MTFLRSPFAFWTSTTSTTRASSSGFSIKFHAILLASFISTIYGFTFRFTTPPTQCESLKAIWEGGTPPYKLLLVPVDFMPEGTETRIIFERTISTGNELTFTFPFPARTRFAAIMSDATGFGTGGTSPLINIRSSNSSSCLPTSPSKPNFYFYLSPSTLTQCSPVHISWDSSPSSPVTVYGVIPQGQSFNLNADSRASGGRGFDWTVNVRSGTQMFFVVGDSSGSGKGGSSDVTTVRSGSSSRCIDATSPSSTEDAGVGGTAPLPGSTQTGGGSGSNGSSSVSGSSPSGSSPSNGSGSGSGNGSGGNGNGDGGGTGNGGSGGGGTSNGSGGGTVQGPLDPSSGANGANADSSRSSKLGLILGLVLGLSGLGIVLGLCFVFYKRRQREKKRRDNQRARLLASSDVSEVHLPQDHADLPHQRPAPFATRAWPGTSLENLGSVWRTTPFIWPIGGGGGGGSGGANTSPRESPGANRDRDNDPSVTALGNSTARPAMEERDRSSSSVLRRLRSIRYGGGGSGSGNGSGFGLGFPFGVGGATDGYQSLDGTPSGRDDSTPSSYQRHQQQQHHQQNPSGNTSSSLFATAGHGNSNSQDSTQSGLLRTSSRDTRGETHKSPLPPSYIQHISNRSRGSDQSHLGGGTPGMISTPSEHLTRPNLGPIRGPRPLPGQDSELAPVRPGMDRASTSGSIWEVPPTYTSLERRIHQE